MKIKELALKLLLGKSWESQMLLHLSKFDGFIEGKAMSCGYLSSDINDIVYYATHLTRKLLKEKGFSNTIHAFTEKHVLLGTEISELADAIKKGKGDQEEGEELADIVIRACNFLCCDEMWDLYSETFSPYAYNDNDDIIQVIVPTHKDDNDIDKKYAILSEMMDVVGLIKDNASIVATSQSKPNRCTHMSGIIEEVYELIALCRLYSELFLPSNLQIYISDKMKYNFTRPYQYNTCKEFNK